jgi:predicted dehydrogenase
MTRPLNIAMIGCGGVASFHLPAYQRHPDRVRLVAVCDPCEPHAQRRARETGVKAIYTDPARMLAEVDCDAVDICAIHDCHAELAIMSARAGRHVLVEKPMACSLAECRAMIDAADRAAVILMVGQMQRYHPSYRGVRNIIRGGELGPIRAARIDAMQNAPEGMASAAWLLDGARAGGGILISVAVHKIDLLRFLLGEVKRITGITRAAHPAFTSGAEDYAAAILEFENGAIGEIFGTYSGFRMPWAEMFMIFGDDGTIHAVPPIGQYGGPAYVASRRRTPKLQQFHDMFHGFEPVEDAMEELTDTDPFINQALHFAECCRTGQEPLSGGRDNLNTMKVIFGIYESARSGAAVELGA